MICLNSLKTIVMKIVMKMVMETVMEVAMMKIAVATVATVAVTSVQSRNWPVITLCALS